jgi:hypothetical protein
MKLALRDLEGLVGRRACDAVDKAMLGGEASGPPTGKIASEGFGLSQTSERIAHGVGDQGVELDEIRLIGRAPELVLRPGVWRED